MKKEINFENKNKKAIFESIKHNQQEKKQSRNEKSEG